MKYKVYFVTFGNFSSKVILDIIDVSDVEGIKKEVYDIIKDDNHDWPLTMDDLEVTKIIPVKTKE